jgi:hypothetical protein
METLHTKPLYTKRLRHKTSLNTSVANEFDKFSARSAKKFGRWRKFWPPNNTDYDCKTGISDFQKFAVSGGSFVSVHCKYLEIGVCH